MRPLFRWAFACMNWLKQHGPILLIRWIAKLPLIGARAAGSLAGRIAWLSQSSGAVITQKNLKLCFPDMPNTQRKALAKRSLIETSKTFCELGAIWLWPDKKLQPTIKQIEGGELFEQAKADNKGVIVITPHLGNWEVLGYQLAKMGGITCMYLRPDNPDLDQLMINGRGLRGIKLAPADRSGVMTTFKLLKRREVSGILPDQVPEDGAGAFAPFFGQSAYTMKLVSTLAAKTQCKVVIAYAKRVPGGFDVVIKAARDGIDSTDLATSLAAMNASVEDAIKEIPEQYQWAYKRFKKRSDGQRKFYQSIKL